MKRKILFTTLLGITCLNLIMFTSCNKENEIPDPVPAPGNLAVSNITTSTAKLSWEGSADAYEITLGTQIIDTVKTTYYDLVGLEQNTEYTWEIRAQKNDINSESVKGPAFKTEEEKFFTINAEVVNGSDYDALIDTVKAETYNENGEYFAIATAPYLNGAFTLNLPLSMSDAYVYDFLGIEEGEGVPDGIIISDPTIKGFSFEEIHGYKNGAEVDEAYFTQAGYNISMATLTMELSFVEYMYVDKAATITGGYSNEVEGTASYDISFQEGWNIIYFIVKTTLEGEYEVTVTTRKPSSITYKWYYGDDMEDELDGILEAPAQSKAKNILKKQSKQKFNKHRLF